MRTLQLERYDDGLAVLRLDNPDDRMNKLSTATMKELSEAIEAIADDPSITGLILISGKEDNFIVGADINEFEEMARAGTAADIIPEAQALFSRVEALRIPTLAAIHGPCLGGGLELALSCRFRVATDHPSTVIGLPEVKLGILPAAGGTQRLTRLIGVRKALPMMVAGRVLNARKAKSMGIIDSVAYPCSLLESARACLLSLSSSHASPALYPPLWSLDQVLRLSPVRRLYFNIAKKQITARTLGNYPAPVFLTECVEAGIARGMQAGLESEVTAFQQLVSTPVSQELRHLFFSSAALRKNPLRKEAREVKLVGVLGSGLMGSGIATVSAQAGCRVLLRDVSWSNIAGGLKKVWDHFDQNLQRGKLRTPVDRDRLFGLITPTTGLESFEKADIVIEAVYEDLDLKHQVVRDIEAVIRPDCVLATNTSAIPVSRIASVSARPENVIGMHYFSPVPRMPLLEVVVTPETAPWVVATAVGAGLKQGKTVIVVKDGPGFYTSRVLGAYMHEAVNLLSEGALIRKVDEVMRRFGFPLGPFKLLDEVGIDVAAHVSEELSGLFAERGFAIPANLMALLRDDFKGRKNGRGFYQYGTGWRRKLLKKVKVAGGRWMVNRQIYKYFGSKRRKNIDPLEIQDRLALSMVNESVYCLQEGIIAAPRDGDIGAVLGLGFPPFRGGPFRYLETIGLSNAVDRLNGLASRLGPRFSPAPLLVDTARSGGLFYPRG